MQLNKVRSLADATENSLEAIYEICLLVAAASGSFSIARFNGLREVFDSIKTGIYYVENWETPTGQLEPFVPIIFGEETGLGDHERLFNEFLQHMQSMDPQEFEDHLYHCASLITKRHYRLFTIRTALTACQSEGVGESEAIRFERFINEWWGYKDKESIDGVWDEVIGFSGELESKISESNANDQP